MHSKGNLNTNYTSHFKAIGIHEYNQSLRNPNKKLQGDLDSLSMPKLLEGGMGLEGMGYHHDPQRVSMKRLTLPLMASQTGTHK
jgi:hypothetical protein